MFTRVGNRPALNESTVIAQALVGFSVFIGVRLSVAGNMVFILSSNYRQSVAAQVS